MNFKQARKAVKKSAKFWINNLGLGYWSVNLYYPKKIKEMPDTIATCAASWQYARADLCFGKQKLVTLDAIEIDRLVLHELCHALVNELREKDKDLKHEERVCSMLTNAFIWVRDAREKRSDRSI